MGIQDEAEERLRPTDDHDLLIRVHERVTSIQQQLSTDKTQQALKDQERDRRIEALELWRSNLTGRFTVIVAASTLVGGFIVQLVTAWIRSALIR